MEISATHLRRFHLVATLIWMAMVVPTVLIWHSSVLWVALMSVWANVASHWAAWQSSRTETKTEES